MTTPTDRAENRAVDDVKEASAAERDDIIEMCAKVAEQAERDYLSPEYATGQPMSSLAERIACRHVATAIRSLKSQPAQEGK